MANPNIFTPSALFGNVSLLKTTTAGVAVVWTELTPSVNYVHKINSITAANNTGGTQTVTLSINSATAGGGTAYRFAGSVTIPAISTFVISDKSTAFYVGENQSIVVTASTLNGLDLIASYEAITDVVDAAAAASGVTATATLGNFFILRYAQTQQALFAFGDNAGLSVIRNLVSSTGVIASDTSGTGTGRYYLAAAAYGQDKAIFGYGTTNGSSGLSLTNLVSNTGSIATDTTGVGTTRWGLAATGYGDDNAIFGFGTTAFSTYTGVTNLVSNTGVVASDTTAVGAARYGLAAARYGTDTGIFIYGYPSAVVNLVSNTGVIASNTAITGTTKYQVAAATFGNGRAIFAFGYTGSASVSTVSLISNTGVMGSSTSTVASGGNYSAGTNYGGDKAIIAFGLFDASNLVSNTGVVAANVTLVGTSRKGLGAAGYGS